MQISLVVGCLVERGLPVVTPLNNVLRESGQRIAGLTRHFEASWRRYDTQPRAARQLKPARKTCL
jgi:hypothetical protein